jgi:hypothetical protein
MVATAGSDLNLAEKAALKTYTATHLLEVGAVARVSRIEILDRVTGATSSFTFVGAGAGAGAGIVSADITDKWHPFDTKNPITLDYFANHAATLYNVSAGIGFNWAPISGIHFLGLDLVYSSAWQSFWNGNSISLGGLTTVNAGTSLDISEVGGVLIPGKREDGDPDTVKNLDEINQMCIENGLPAVPTTSVMPAAADQDGADNGAGNSESLYTPTDADGTDSSTGREVHLGGETRTVDDAPVSSGIDDLQSLTPWTQEGDLSLENLDLGFSGEGGSVPLGLVEAGEGSAELTGNASDFASIHETIDYMAIDPDPGAGVVNAGTFDLGTDFAGTGDVSLEAIGGPDIAGLADLSTPDMFANESIADIGGYEMGGVVDLGGDMPVTDYGGDVVTLGGDDGGGMGAPTGGDDGGGSFPSGGGDF